MLRCQFGNASNPRSFKKLCDRAGVGDPGALEELGEFLVAWGKLVPLWKKVSKEEREDALSNVYVRVLTRMEKGPLEFPSEAKARNYLVVCYRNLMMDLFRARTKHTSYLQASRELLELLPQSLSFDPSHGLNQKALYRFVDGLPVKEMYRLALRDICDMALSGEKRSEMLKRTNQEESVFNGRSKTAREAARRNRGHQQ